MKYKIVKTKERFSMSRCVKHNLQQFAHKIDFMTMQSDNNCYKPDRWQL